VQRRRQALDEVEEALAAGSDVRAVLDVRRRPVALSREVVSLVEQGIEGLKYECFIPLLCRLTHNDLLVVWRLRKCRERFIAPTSRAGCGRNPPRQRRFRPRCLPERNGCLSPRPPSGSATRGRSRAAGRCRGRPARSGNTAWAPDSARASGSIRPTPSPPPAARRRGGSGAAT